MALIFYCEWIPWQLLIFEGVLEIIFVSWWSTVCQSDHRRSLKQKWTSSPAKTALFKQEYLLTQISNSFRRSSANIEANISLFFPPIRFKIKMEFTESQEYARLRSVQSHLRWLQHFTADAAFSLRETSQLSLGSRNDRWKLNNQIFF